MRALDCEKKALICTEFAKRELIFWEMHHFYGIRNADRYKNGNRYEFIARACIFALCHSFRWMLVLLLACIAAQLKS